MAQGNLVIGGLGVDAADGSKLTFNVPSSGRIANGATIERAVDTGFAQGDHLLFNLHQFYATNATGFADAINRPLGPSAAARVGCARHWIRFGGGSDDRMRVVLLVGTIHALHPQ